MEEILRIIVAEYLNSEVTSITDFSSIALPGSILIHRMYAAILKATKVELSVSEYMAVGTFGELKKLINSKKGAPLEHIEENTSEDVKNNLKQAVPSNGRICIGFDIESIDKFPKVDDFRESKFYKDSFTPKEISYCILQPNSYQSFAGKFSAKEAIIKTGKIKSITKLKDIEIINDETGKPLFRDFCISISHTSNYAAACAVWLNERVDTSSSYTDHDKVVELEHKSESLSQEISSIKTKLKLAYISLGISLTALALFFLINLGYISN